MGRKAIAGAATAAIAAVVAAGAWALSGSPAPPASGIVAAESAWGSLVPGATSLVSSPAADPHDYEPTASDARLLAEARLVIVNGAGYDAWATRLLAANPVRRRRVVDAAKLAGVARGGNPHLWYAPSVVQRVARAAGAPLPPAYLAGVAEARRRLAGSAVGASESIVVPLARALGLRLLTPTRLLDSVSEGVEPTAADLTTARRQITGRAIRAWIVNTQNLTPEVKRLTALARRSGIPVVSVTETPAPAGVTFAVWQLRQLHALERALGR